MSKKRLGALVVGIAILSVVSCQWIVDSLTAVVSEENWAASRN
jgi:hypothetical protein